MPIPSTHLSLLCDIREDKDRDESWVVFNSRYHGVILGWCVRRGLPQDGAEDLTQDILLKLFQQLPTYHHDPARGQFRGWLKTVVNNTITDFWRRLQRRPDADAIGGTAFLKRVADLTDHDACGDLSSVIDAHARTTAAEIFERVRSKLKETTWQAFHQAMVDGRPAAEIAAGLNLSIASVYKATYRVKQMLLEEYRHAHVPRTNADPLPKPGDTSETPA